MMEAEGYVASGYPKMVQCANCGESTVKPVLVEGPPPEPGRLSKSEFWCPVCAGALQISWGLG